MKKYLSIILAILLVMSALTGCAGKNNPTKQDNALNTTATDPETAPVSESSNSPSVSNTSAAYEKLIAYKTDNYSQQSVADFNNLLLDNNDFLELWEAHSDVMAAISPKGIRMTITVLASLPIFALYPFMQKYFSKGIMVGAVKG